LLTAEFSLVSDGAPWMRPFGLSGGRRWLWSALLRWCRPSTRARWCGRTPARR